MTTSTPGDPLVPARQVQAEFGVTAMTLWRWVDRRENTGFPAPIKINNRNYWRRSALETFKASLEDTAAA